MPGMNKNSRTIALILASLHRLESDPATGAMDALGLLDEIRRLERKWNEQVAAGSPRRVGADFLEMKGWLRRWVIAARRFEEAAVREAIGRVERELGA
jgi:hypothetical protein